MHWQKTQKITLMISDTENTIRQLDLKIQNTFRHMGSTKIKQMTTPYIKDTNTTSTRSKASYKKKLNNNQS